MRLRVPSYSLGFFFWAVLSVLTAVAAISAICWSSVIRGAMWQCMEIGFVIASYLNTQTVFAFLLAALTGAGLLSALYFVVRELVRTSRMLKLVTSEDRVMGGRYSVISAQTPFAVTLGFFRPEIVISQGLIDHCTADELEAIVLHEEVHKQRRDPLRRLVLGVGAQICFFVPVISDISRSIIDDQESFADREVRKIPGMKAHLESAIHRVTSGQLEGLKTSCGFSTIIERYRAKNRHSILKTSLISLSCSALLLVGGLWSLQGAQASPIADESFAAGDFTGAVCEGKIQWKLFGGFSPVPGSMTEENLSTPIR